VSCHIDPRRAAGYSDRRIIFRQWRPTWWRRLIMFTAFIAQAILLEPHSHFLGLASPATPAWGLMLSGMRRLLSRGALDDPVSGRRHQPRCSPSKPVRRRAGATISTALQT